MTRLSTMQEGVKGEFYPCKPDIFAATYEPVAEGGGTDAMSKQQIVKQIQKHAKAISKERDALRDLLADLQQMEEDSSEAVESLEAAVEALSRLF